MLGFKSSCIVSRSLRQAHSFAPKSPNTADEVIEKRRTGAGSGVSILSAKAVIPGASVTIEIGPNLERLLRDLLKLQAATSAASSAATDGPVIGNANHRIGLALRTIWKRSRQLLTSFSKTIVVLMTRSARKFGVSAWTVGMLRKLQQRPDLLQEVIAGKC